MRRPALRSHLRDAARIQICSMVDKAFEPGQLVIKLGPRLGIAVRRIQAADDDAVHGSFEIAGLRIRAVARQSATDFHRFGIAREDCHAIKARFLALPERAIPSVMYRLNRKLFVVDAQLLQTHYVGLRFFEPVEQAR